MAAVDIGDEVKARIAAKNPSVLDVCKTAWLIMALGFDTKAERICAVLKVAAASAALVANTAAQYAFPPLIGHVLEAATTQGDPDYIKSVAAALCWPLLLSIGMLLVEVSTSWWWFTYTIAMRRDIGLRLNEMLFRCDKGELSQRLDTPDQRIQSDTKDFLYFVFSNDGIVHGILTTTASMLAGLVISESLVGPGATAAVVGYAAAQTALEVWAAAPMQQNTQELTYATGHLRQALALVATGQTPPGEEKVTLEHLQHAQKALYTVNLRLIVIQFRMTWVTFLGSRFKEFVVVYVVALLPILIGAAPPPPIDKLVQTTITLNMLLNFLLSMSKVFQAYFHVAGLRNRVQDMYDALAGSQALW